MNDKQLPEQLDNSFDFKIDNGITKISYNNVNDYIDYTSGFFKNPLATLVYTYAMIDVIKEQKDHPIREDYLINAFLPDHISNIVLNVANDIFRYNNIIDKNESIYSLDGDSIIGRKIIRALQFTNVMSGGRHIAYLTRRFLNLTPEILFFSYYRDFDRLYYNYISICWLALISVRWGQDTLNTMKQMRYSDASTENSVGFWITAYKMFHRSGPKETISKSFENAYTQWSNNSQIKFEINMIDDLIGTLTKSYNEVFKTDIFSKNALFIEFIYYSETLAENISMAETATLTNGISGDPESYINYPTDNLFKLINSDSASLPQMFLAALSNDKVDELKYFNDWMYSDNGDVVPGDGHKTVDLFSKDEREDLVYIMYPNTNNIIKVDIFNEIPETYMTLSQTITKFTIGGNSIYNKSIFDFFVEAFVDYDMGFKKIVDKTSTSLKMSEIEFKNRMIKNINEKLQSLLLEGMYLKFEYPQMQEILKETNIEETIISTVLKKKKTYLDSASFFDIFQKLKRDIVTNEKNDDILDKSWIENINIKNWKESKFNNFQIMKINNNSYTAMQNPMYYNIMVYVTLMYNYVDFDSFYEKNMDYKTDMDFIQTEVEFCLNKFKRKFPQKYFTPEYFSKFILPTPRYYPTTGVKPLYDIWYKQMTLCAVINVYSKLKYLTEKLLLYRRARIFIISLYNIYINRIPITSVLNEKIRKIMIELDIESQYTHITNYEQLLDTVIKIKQYIPVVADPNLNVIKKTIYIILGSIPDSKIKYYPIMNYVEAFDKTEKMDNDTYNFSTYSEKYVLDITGNDKIELQDFIKSDMPAFFLFEDHENELSLLFQLVYLLLESTNVSGSKKLKDALRKRVGYFMHPSVYFESESAIFRQINDYK